MTVRECYDCGQDAPLGDGVPVTYIGGGVRIEGVICEACYERSRAPRPEQVSPACLIGGCQEPIQTERFPSTLEGWEALMALNQDVACAGGHTLCVFSNKDELVCRYHFPPRYSSHHLERSR